MTSSSERSRQPPRVLAIASAGGHWIQLLRLRSAWSGARIAFVSTNKRCQDAVAPARLYVVHEANRWNKAGLLLQALGIFLVILRERPDIVISTGAAPGYFALRLGKCFGARTIWIDSMANAQAMSLSGQRIGAYADLWLTQWRHLARPKGPHFAGAVVTATEKHSNDTGNRRNTAAF